MRTNFVVFFTIALSLVAFGAEDEAQEQDYSVGTSYRSEYIYPSNYGMSGIFRTRSAESLPEGTLTFGIGGELYSVANAPDVSGTGTTAATIAESLFVGYSPNSKLTFAAMRRNSSTTYGTPSTLTSSLGDFNFAALYTFPVLGRTLAIAPIVDVLVASDFNNLVPAGNMVSAGGGLAATASLYPVLGIPLFGHANLIYHMAQMRSDASLLTGNPRPETFFAFSRYPTITSRLGAEFQLGNFIPFIEFQHKFQISSSISWPMSPSTATLGARFTPLENKSFSFLLGADVGIGKPRVAGVPFTSDWQVLGQLSYTAALVNTERKHYSSTKDVHVVNRKFVITKNINFKVGSADLEEESKSLLDQIAQIIKENDVHRLHIVGHTDSSYTDDFNLKLSHDRAGTVKSFLVAKGVSDEGLSTQGYGKRKPKASNVSASGRAINRRVEFFVLD